MRHKDGCTRADIATFIANAGRKGRKFTEIQRFICEKNGLDFDERRKVSWDTTKIRRRYRGYYCTNLLGLHGCFEQRTGILEKCSVRQGSQYIALQFVSKKKVHKIAYHKDTLKIWQRFLKQSLQQSWDTVKA
jgi:hypothetical protein